MRKGDNIRERKDGRFEARYIKGRDKNGKIIYGYCYGKSREEALEKRKWQLDKINKPAGPKLMNLLILGAGSHGREVFEIAENLKCFNTIKFIDDNIDLPNVVGTIEDLPELVNDFSLAFPAVGSSSLRKKWLDIIVQAGYIIPTLIDPSAVISKSCEIGYATVVGAMAVVNSGAIIGNGCIVSSGAVIGRDALMEDWSFINSGETLIKEGKSNV